MRPLHSPRIAAGGLAPWLLALLGGAVLAAPAPSSSGMPTLKSPSEDAKGSAAAESGTAIGREARALLADRCFACHGPDEVARSRTGDLRLDDREGAFRDLGGYAAIVPGQPDASELMRRVTHAEPQRRMPPESSKLPPLTAVEVDLLSRWIEADAPYEQHWSFLPLQSPPVPARLGRSSEGAGAWGSDVLDRFVVARLREAGLEPAPPADTETWARRVALDLTGLPPERAAVDELTSAADSNAADARAAFVDALLAAPTFGEHQAARWLDLARYAETHGYQSDRERAVWPWRDWLIKAWNDDLPYDAFVTRLLAGDLLPEASRDDRLATAFLRLHRQTNEGGSVEEEFRQEYVADRVNTVGTTFLGLTLECARCHDHKFDPVSQRDYYALSAFLDDADESGLYSHFTDATPTPKLLLPEPDQEQRLAELDASIAAMEARLAGQVDAARARFEAWCDEASEPEPGVAGLIGRFDFDPGSPDEEPGTALIERGANRLDPEAHCTWGSGVSTAVGETPTDGALLFEGDNEVRVPNVGEFARWDPFSIQVRLRIDRLRERMVVLHRSRAWTDAASQGYELLLEEGRPAVALIHFWPGDAIRVRATQPIETERWTTLTFTYDGSSRADGLALYVNGAQVEVEVDRDHLVQGIRGGGPGDLSLGARFRDRGLAGGLITDLIVAARELTSLEVAHLAGGAQLQSALHAKSPREEALFDWWCANEDDELRASREELRAARRQRGELLDSLPSIMVMEDGPIERTAHVLARGRYDSPGAAVEPDVPPALGAWPQGLPRTRLGLAAWLTTPEHPLTARVEVNRLWQSLFGVGLVASAEDWGVQGAPATHPELLDHLASSFVQDGWSRKRLLRRIVLSATYAQSSRASAESLATDPTGQLLSRYPARRLPGEVLRDQALFASGLLTTRVGGPPVKPYQPDGLWREKSGLTYSQSTGEGLWRRSLYTFWKRTSPPPTMMLFDASKRDVCTARRQLTSTPLQALVLFNDPQFVEAARALAERAFGEGATDRQRLEALATHLALPLSETELQRLLKLLDELEVEQRGDPEGSLALLAIGSSPPWPDSDGGPGVARRAAWALVASTLLSHPDVVYAR